MNDIAISITYQHNTASKRWGFVHWPWLSSFKHWNPLIFVVLVLQSWKNCEHIFFVDILCKTIEKRTRQFSDRVVGALVGLAGRPGRPNT